MQQQQNADINNNICEQIITFLVYVHHYCCQCFIIVAGFFAHKHRRMEVLLTALCVDWISKMTEVELNDSHSQWFEPLYWTEQND